MSCDSGCQEALDHLYEVLDGECDETRGAAVRSHLAECGHCREQYDLESEVRSLVARACCTQAPDELRRRIITRITQIRVSTSGGGSASVTSVQQFRSE
jgi:mycothiol system anti-sigma-R factor